ncbi:glycosyltransferase, partial [Raoultella ornithinolytica]|uniref:glycosyltransferase n=1 Tax=Raoultella ornithinolytica TaxID=54291 RepID=UPI00385771E3
MLVKNSFKSNAAATRNQGARMARSEWICLLDSDDAFSNNKLLSLMELINSKADVYYNKAIVYFDNRVED